jgi:hypothetical protein
MVQNFEVVPERFVIGRTVLKWVLPKREIIIIIIWNKYIHIYICIYTVASTKQILTQAGFYPMIVWTQHANS